MGVKLGEQCLEGGSQLDPKDRWAQGENQEAVAEVKVDELGRPLGCRLCAMVRWSENSVGKRTEKPREGGCWDLA